MSLCQGRTDLSDLVMFTMPLVVSSGGVRPYVKHVSGVALTISRHA